MTYHGYPNGRAVPYCGEKPEPKRIKKIESDDPADNYEDARDIECQKCRREIVREWRSIDASLEVDSTWDTPSDRVQGEDGDGA